MEDSLKNKIKVRHFIKSQDEAFIYDTWINVMYFGNEYCRLIDEHLFHSKYHEYIEHILSKQSVSVSVACLDSDADVILGYCVYDDDVLYWIYTKPAFRKFGIAKHIMPSNIKTVTNLNKVGKAMKHKIKGMKYNPFQI